MLTNREKEVLKYLCMGLNNKEIAEKLYISSHTSKAHVTAILRKLNLKNRIVTAYFAGKNNLVEID
ncbi:response regulator transcription factor [bacterium]|nr:response regulator transcription factor [bacterium]MBQ9245505.1 response regulator transcription factor [bacterium]MBQ9246942.1 response regulator transcription factor [bacterium]